MKKWIASALALSMCFAVSGMFSGCSCLKGEPGEPGKSAYEIWLDQGNTGTEADFLNSLKAPGNIDSSICAHANMQTAELGLGNHTATRTVDEEGNMVWEFTPEKVLKLCPDCDYHEIVEVVEHEFESITVESTCYRAGYVGYACTVCGYYITEELPLGPHQVVVDGITYIMDKDDTFYPMNGENSYAAVIRQGATTVAKCDQNNGMGVGVYTCSMCDCMEIVETYRGHEAGEFIEWVEEPTADKEGIAVYVCKECGERFEKVVPPTEEVVS